MCAQNNAKHVETSADPPLQLSQAFFYSSEISKQSEILYNLQLKGRVTNLFTLGGQEDALAKVGSLSPTMVEARGEKDDLYNSEENGTEGKWEAKFCRTAPDNYSPPSQVPQYHPGMG